MPGSRSVVGKAQGKNVIVPCGRGMTLQEARLKKQETRKKKKRLSVALGCGQPPPRTHICYVGNGLDRSAREKITIIIVQESEFGMPLEYANIAYRLGKLQTPRNGEGAVPYI